MWHTHAVFGINSLWLLTPLLNQTNTINVGLLAASAALGALVPDLDAAESKIKHTKVFGVKPLLPISSILHRDLGHRGFLHSARGWALWTLLISPLAILIGWLPIVALSLGYASHLMGDACTHKGIPLRYPNQKRFCLLPKQFRIVTGSDIEEAVFVAFACLICALLLSFTALSL